MLRAVGEDTLASLCVLKHGVKQSSPHNLFIGLRCVLISFQTPILISQAKRFISSYCDLGLRNKMMSKHFQTLERRNSITG